MYEGCYIGRRSRHSDQLCFDEMRISGEIYRVVGELENTDIIMCNSF